jgi:nicotinamide-nucleotide amidase
MIQSPYHLAEQLGQQLRTCGAKVTVAESCTGGGIAQAITSVPGSSAWFDYGFVTYSNQAKTRLLGVPESLLQSVGAVSGEVVSAMVAGAVRMAGCSFGAAVSGIAGPDGGTAEKPVGTVWFAWAHPAGLTSECHWLAGDRAQVREQAVILALTRLVGLVSGCCIKTQ